MRWKWNKRTPVLSIASTNKTLVMASHHAEQPYADALREQLHLLSLKLSLALVWFEYPRLPAGDRDPSSRLGIHTWAGKQEAQEYQVLYPQWVSSLERPALFLPLVSPSFVRQLWKDMQEDEELNIALSCPSFPVVPVLVRPVLAMPCWYANEPLADYAEGLALERACATIVSGLERVLHQQYQRVATAHPLLAVLSGGVEPGQR